MRRAFVLAPLVLLACTELPAIEAGLCGNAVVERSAGEDCDSFSAPGSTCLPPGDARECRYDCSAGADGTRPDCPAGMSCGVDGTCRWPSGSFDPPSAALAGDIRSLLSGDLDGDRREELLLVEGSRARVTYFANDLVPEAELEIPSESKHGLLPAIAELSEDGLADVVVPHEGGIVTALGSSERVLRPTGHPSVVLPPDIDEARALSLELLPQLPGDEVVLLGSTTKYDLGSIVYVDKQLANESITVTLPPSKLGGGLLAAGLDEDPTASPCDEIFLAFRDSDSALVYEPCMLDPTEGIVLAKNAAPTILKLPKTDVVVGPTAIADLDGDGHQDLGIVAKSGATHYMEVAYGLGDGTFHATTPVPASGDNQFSRVYAIGETPPLAIADMNADGVFDFVTAGGVWVWRPAGLEQTGASSVALGEAVIADLNSNGHPDVLASYAEQPGAIFFNGSGDGHTSAWQVESQAPLSRLAIGDFDGDLILDVAASERAEPGASFASVLFGRLWAPPESPLHMGLMDPLLQLLPARSSPPGTPVTLENDIITLSLASDQRFVFAGYAGRSDRNLRSPYVTVRTVGSGELVSFDAYEPLRLVTGNFDADAHPDLIELGASLGGERRLWLVPVTQGARIRPSDASASEPLPNGALFDQGMMASADLDGDGIDEVVLLAPAKSGPGSYGVIATASGTLQLGEPEPLAPRFGADESLAGVGARRLLARDLDLDGAVDLLALDEQGELWLRSGTGQKDLTGFEKLLAPSEPIVAFALIAADRDPEPELVILLGAGAFVADRRSDGAYALAPAAAAELPGATLLSTGDYDGDGVADIALGSSSSVLVARGAPGLR